MRLQRFAFSVTDRDPRETKSHPALREERKALPYHTALLRCGIEGGELTAQRHMQLLRTVFAQLRESVSLGDVIHRLWPTVNKTAELDS